MKSVVEHLSHLVRIPSPSPVSNRPLIDYASAVLGSAGWSTRELPYRDDAGVEKINLILAPPGQDPHTRDLDLVFVCHTDTVPYAADWAGALDPAVLDGQLHGCGACDVKGFLACLLAAAPQTSAKELADGVRIVLTAEEEIGCIGAARLVAEDVLRPRRMIIGEPTMLHPARAGKGYCLAEVVVHGKEAHSAHPDEGISAIFHAATLIDSIQSLAGSPPERVNHFFDPPRTTLNVGTIHGGTAKNIVPGECRFQLEWRPIPDDSADEVGEVIAGLLPYFSATRPGFRAEIHNVRQQAGFETPADSPLVRRLESLAGRPAVSIPFGSEASVFAAVAEEVIVFGPGDMRTAHSSRECVPLAELDEAVSLVAALMRGV